MVKLRPIAVTLTAYRIGERRYSKTRKGARRRRPESRRLKYRSKSYLRRRY